MTVNMNTVHDSKPPLIVIMGPTASGKSDLALRLGADLNGEIISADSMQLYKNIAIGTAQPTAEERRMVPHHLIDCLDFDQRMAVYEFVHQAEDLIERLQRAGKNVIIAGGSGMYIHSLLYGLDPLPQDSALRSSLDAQYDSPDGEILLHAVMSNFDPEALEKWRKHRRKLIRALEVFLITGESILALQRSRIQPQLRYKVIAKSLQWDREELKTRIRQRTVKMLQNGWIEEALAAEKMGLFSSPTAYQVLGYRSIIDYCQKKLNYSELVEQISTATWQLARRQLTWFRNQHPESEILPMMCDYPQLLNEVKTRLQNSN